jgi:hypothetical protein
MVTVDSMQVRALPADGSGAAVGLYRLPVYVSCVLLAVVTNYVLGKDMAWDTLNYHFYAGFSAIHDRFAQDYFAAGLQSYFNPYPYVLFYALVSAGLSALTISSLLAVVQSAILWLTYELAVCVCHQESRPTRVLIGVCAVLLAYVNPILMQQFGSTFADITTGEMVVGGWLLLALAVRERRLAPVIFAGLILGAATALKPTNAVHALAATALLLMMAVGMRKIVQAGFWYGASAALGFVATTAPWSWKLAHRFGNPMFPLLNGLFRSPEFTTARLIHYRFIPGSFVGGLLRPFAIATPMPLVDEELRAPDIRYALTLVLALALLGAWLWSRRGRRPHPAGDGRRESGSRVLAAVGLGLAVDWIAWLTVSGNGRYFLPMACVTAVVAIALLFRLLGRWPKARNYLLVAIFAAQCVQLAMGTEFRWNPAPWHGRWFDISVPKQLATEPNLYLTIGVQSDSFVAPYLSPKSGLINFDGDYVLGPDGANGKRVRRLIDRYYPAVRVLLRGKQLYSDKRLSPSRAAVDRQLAAFALRTDTADCQRIVVHGLSPDLQFTFSGVSPVDAESPGTTDMVSCRVVADQEAYQRDAAQRRDADKVLNRLEDACPQLFQPRRGASEPFSDGYLRFYVNTDLIAWVSRGWVKFQNPIRGDGLFYVGRESDWLRSAQRVDCGRHGEHYYAKLVEPAGEH